MKPIFTTLLALTAVLFAGCSDGNSIDEQLPATEPSLSVGTNSVTLGSAAGAEASFTLTANTSWTAQTTGSGFTVNRLSGTETSTIRVTADAANNSSAEAELGTVTFSASGAVAQTVHIRQSGTAPTPPTPGDVTLTLDFAQGPSIATPALPGTSETALSGRHVYTMAGHQFAVYADAEDSGKFFWNDNSLYNPNLPDPTKALYFSKIGAYVEFPAIAGKALSKVVLTRCSNGAADVELEIHDTDDVMTTHSKVDLEGGAGWTFELIEPEVNKVYRLVVINRKNAQAATLVLTYAGSN